MTSLLRELVPVPMAAAASSTITSRPASASARATARPTTPAPIDHAIDPVHRLTTRPGAGRCAGPRRRSAAPAGGRRPVEGQALLAQPGVGGGEALQPAQVLDPALVDEVLDVAPRRAGVAEQPPRQRALAQPRAPRLLHHLGKAGGIGRVDLVFHRHHHRAFVGADVDGRRAAGWPGAAGLKSGSAPPSTVSRRVSSHSSGPTTAAA